MGLTPDIEGLCKSGLRRCFMYHKSGEQAGKGTSASMEYQTCAKRLFRLRQQMMNTTESILGLSQIRFGILGGQSECRNDEASIYQVFRVF
jgi:hypothetical protein